MPNDKVFLKLKGKIVKLWLIAIALFVLVLAAGCAGQNHQTSPAESAQNTGKNDGQSQQNSVSPTTPATPSARAATPAQKTETAPAAAPAPKTGAASESTPELTVDAAIKLMDEARDRNYKLLQKGGPCDDFNYINDEDGGYAFICAELNSKEKIQKYLEEAFTSPIADTIIGQLNLRKVDNKLAFSPLDWGSMYDWSGIKVTKTTKDGNKVTFLFKVGLLDASAETKTIEITFKYIDKSGWRVDTKPQHFL
ncbi:DL-endopeptidase inhibitor IseA family protein [Paenibacillus tyrfis]|uniref:DL-endopeptidase inhibitor IseA family protein n=1 Tax=Paenibacillus tyrfis TaxID=1501230 RepID=UPI0015C62325|nr:DL-endopeptidase inhibitor IseA family protein [Paenibacillus tyrfis]